MINTGILPVFFMLYSQAFKGLPFKNISSAQYYVSRIDRSKVLRTTDSDVSIVFQDDAHDNMPVGSELYIKRSGTGSCTVVTSNCTLLPTNTVTLYQHQILHLVKTDVNTWEYDLVVNGFVTITDVQPQSNSENVFVNSRSDDNNVVVTCISSTHDVRVYVYGVTGITSFKPTIYVNDIPATLTRNANTDTWSGYADVTLTDGTITALHEDGAQYTALATIETVPVITSAVFSNPYPAVGQTECAAGQNVTINVTASQPFVQIELLTDNTTATDGLLSSVFASTTSSSITGIVADRGNTTSNYSAKVRVKSIYGTWSTTYITSSAGITDGVNRIKLNNTRPSCSFGSITYSNGFQALKNSETALLGFTASNTDTVVFSSPTNELSITNANTIESTKTVTRISGSYNVSINNIQVIGTRTANNTTTTVAAIVNISNVAPQVSVSVPFARLRSGGNNGTAVQSYVVTLTSNQRTLTDGGHTPTLTASIGTFVGSWSTSNNCVTWTRSIQIHDNNSKGNATFSGLSIYSLSGVQVTTLLSGSNYVVGGFIKRVVSFPVAPNREGTIGTFVVDVSKLQATNLSKGVSGSLNVSYSANLQDDPVSGPFTYTITDPALTANPLGNRIYNNDAVNAFGNNNVNSLLTFEIEELV